MSTDYKYVVEFSTDIDNLIRLDDDKILGCDFNSKIPGDIKITMEFTTLTEAISVPFKCYFDNKGRSDITNGYLKLYQTLDTTSFKSINLKDQILNIYCQK